MTDVQPGDRDREAAARLLPEALVAHYPDTVEDVAHKLGFARAEGYERGRAEGEALRGRVLRPAAEVEHDALLQVDDSDSMACVVGRCWVNAARQFRAAVGADGDGGAR